jgi:HEAT repeat protein
MKALGDEVWEVRMAAVEILGRDKSRESLATLGRLLEKNDDKDVRIGALRVLALRADPESAIYLRAVLKDEDPVIRAAAEQILAELDRREQARKQNPR